VTQETLPVNADTSAAMVGFNLHFNTLEKATLTGKFQRKARLPSLVAVTRSNVLNNGKYNGAY